MSHLVFDKEPDEQNRKENSHQRICKVKQVDAFNMQLRGDKQMGIVNGILEYDGSQTADYTDEKAQEIQKLTVTEMVNLPLDEFVVQDVFLHFHQKNRSEIC